MCTRRLIVLLWLLLVASTRRKTSIALKFTATYCHDGYINSIHRLFFTRIYSEDERYVRAFWTIVYNILLSVVEH